MATTKTKFTVGLFVLIGITIAVVAIIWLWMSHYFEKAGTMLPISMNRYRAWIRIPP